MIVKNANVYHSIQKQFLLKTLVLKNGLIQEESLLKNANFNDTDVIDLQGKYLYPSFVDSHCHLIGIGKQASRLNIESVHDRLELIALLKKNNKNITVFRGWDDNKIGFIPNRVFLDNTNPNNSIILIRRCGHLGIVNTKFIIENRISALDGLDGSDLKVGLLRERALTEAIRKIKFNIAKEKELFVKGTSELLKFGITAIHSEDWNVETIEKILPFLSKQSKIRLSESICIRNLQDLLKWIQIRKHNYKESDFFDLKFIKLYLDGSLGAETAFLNLPYESNESKLNKGVLYFSELELEELITICEVEQISIKIHIIGDGALDVALNAFKKSISKGNPLRHKLIHVQLASELQLKKILDLNLYVSIQPSFLTSDSEMANRKLGKARFRKIAYPFLKMHSLGINLSFSSDAPIETYNPFQTLSSSDLWLDRKTAYKYHSIDAAKSIFLENKLGVLSNNFFFDAFISSQNIFNLSRKELISFIPDSIYFNGDFWTKDLQKYDR